ncbi:MAG: hypothetical protein CMI09_02425 [Oceanospirillaceae bacterium]|nr:hypothetical protein [Oceanospirillaceae bacterium]
MTINTVCLGRPRQTRMKTSFLFLVFAGVFSGCGGEKNSNEFDVTRLLVDTTDKIILPGYQQLATQAELFSAEDGPLAQYCNAIGTGNEASGREAAQSSWRGLVDQWQQAEIHRLGPIADNDEALGKRISSFGSTALDSCGVDQVVVLSRQEEFDIATRSNNQRGLEAIEYVLFKDDLTHTCPSQISVLDDWNDRTEQQRKQWRCEYAQVVANDIRSAAETIHTSWSIDGDNYRSEFLNPATAGSNLELLSDSVFYLDVVVKDLKLGLPLGISDACSEFSCPEQIESPESEYSLANIRNNLVGFSRLIEHEGSSLGDLIRHAGVPDLATRLTDNATAAINLIDSMNSSLLAQANAIDSADAESQCTNAFTNPDADSDLAACRLYGFMKRITDDLKVGFVAAVNVDLPDRAQSDND